MRLSEDAIKRLITAIGFAPQDGKSGIYFKGYPAHNGYSIFVDFNSRTITYDSSENPSGTAIKVWDRRTSDFSKDENFVVLECVDRLLSKGYAPACIELEKNYTSGRGHSGQVDILIKTPDGVPFLMFECKTWGSEYEKEKSKMAKDGGQLFAYYVNARATRFLCLYTSHAGKAVEYRSSVVDVEDDWAGLSEVKDIYSHWNKNFKDNGIFDSYAAPYDIKHKALTYGDLETLKEEDGGKIYHQIMEILRHNAISDKPNAFNKLLNLFVCKIIDEDKNPDDELAFQWLEGDTNESLQLRLNDLYKDGMWRFLEIRVIDYSQDDVAERLASLDSATKQWIMEMYTNTRLKKSPNFAFVEVQDERTFALNAKVVREIVELLQVYKFRYAQRHEFLGNFFELLLNTSMKQEAGQYFTPVPITRFILSSLPLQKLIQGRVDTRNSQPLPTVIDYACGSGHFLTEYMSQIQTIIDSGSIDLRHASPAVRNQFQAWQGVIKFQWAKDYVYGIDLDNRLVKTTKVSAFFNGDGEANIVWANGLDHFTKSETYRDKLKLAHGQDNGQFDILISNPPYSVDSFKGTVAFGEESFTLYPYLTDNSSEIECLFVERMKQLLKVGGWAAVILPSSILTNSGIHARARDILLKYFKFKAIVELGSGTFMKTGTNTVVLFLERRNDLDHVNITREVDQFFVSKNDVAVAGLENAFSTFVSSIYDGLSLDDYLSIFSDAPTEKAKTHELYLDYKKIYGEEDTDKAIAIEKDKMLCFLLTHDQKIVLIKTGKGTEEKKFLGYEFSERRGHEGLHWLSGGTKLYDESNPLNPQKVSSYIYHAFLGKRCEVDKTLTDHVSYGCMSGFIEYGTAKFDKKINLGQKVKVNSVYQMVALNTQVYIVSGVTFDKDDQVTGETSKAILTSDNISNECELQIVKRIYLRDDFLVNDEKRLRSGDIFICLSSGSKEHVGKCAIIKQDIPFFAGGFMGILRKKSDSILMKYLWAVLASTQYRTILGQESTGANINNLGGSLGNIKVPLPPLDVQQKVVEGIEEIEDRERSLRVDVDKIRTEISGATWFSDNVPVVQIDKVAKVQGGKRLGVGESFSAVKTAFPYIRVSDFKNSTVDAANLQYISASQREKIKKYVIRSSDVYISIAGTLGLVGIVPDDLDGANLTENAAKLTPNTDRIDKNFLMYVLRSSSLQQQIQSATVGLGTPKLSLDCIRRLQLPLPPLAEQQKIVAKIQIAEGRIAELNAQLDGLKVEKNAILDKCF